MPSAHPNSLRLGLLQGRHAVRSCHGTVDGHRPEPTQILGTATGLIIDATNIPSAAVSGVVRTVLIGTRVINPIARHAFPSKQRESGCTGGSEPGAALFDYVVGAGEQRASSWRSTSRQSLSLPTRSHVPASIALTTNVALGAARHIPHRSHVHKSRPSPPHSQFWLAAYLAGQYLVHGRKRW